MRKLEEFVFGILIMSLSALLSSVSIVVTIVLWKWILK